MAMRLTAATLAMTACAAAMSQAPVDTLVLSPEQCVEIALDENPTIKVADLEIKRMDYSKKETIGQLLPSVAFGATYNRTLAKQTMYMNMGAFGGGSGSGSGSPDEGGGEQPAEKPKSNGIKVGLDNSWSVGFTASMPIIAPQLWKTLSLSDSRILETLEKARESRVDLVNQVKSAYYQLLLADDSYKVILESYDMAKFTADLYKRQFEAGAASQYDVLRTEVAVKNVEPELSQAEIAIRQARLQLALLMGLDASAAVVKADRSLSKYEESMYEHALSLDTAINGNTSLRLLDIQTRQLRDALTIQKMSLMPTLALTANYNWTTMSNGSPVKGLQWNPYSSIGLTLSIPLFEGFQRMSRIKQARLQVDEMAWQRENLVRSINMQVELAVDNINMNIKQIASCSESVKQAETAHDIQKRSFEIGAASYLDLRDSELALTRSRLAYYQSIYNYLVADSELERLLGNGLDKK